MELSASLLEVQGTNIFNTNEMKPAKSKMWENLQKIKKTKFLQQINCETKIKVGEGTYRIKFKKPFSRI